MNTTTNNAAGDNIIDGAITEVGAENPMATFNPTQYAAVAFEPFKKRFAAAKRAANKAEFDITTKDGMKEVKGIAKSFREIRTGLETARKEAKEPILEAGRKIDAVAKELTAEVVPFEEKYTKLIEDEEARIEEEKQRKIAAERARIEAIESRIAHIRNLSAQLASADSATLSAKVEELATKRLDPAMYDEHLDDAVNALNTAVDELRALHQQALEREAYNRQVAAERAELERLRAEQAERDRVAAEQQRQAEAAAAEQAERMRQMQAEQEKNQRIMQELQRIQQIGMREGDARALLDNLEFAKALELDLNWFGGMASMAQMAKDMAITSLTSKYQAALALELPLAHEEALAEDMRITSERTADMREPGFHPITDEQIAALSYQAQTEGIPHIDSVRVIVDSAEPAASGLPMPEALAPSDDEIIAVLVDHFGETRATIATWLLDLDPDHLESIIAESLK
jgi:myosin heavy subunit